MTIVEWLRALDRHQGIDAHRSHMILAQIAAMIGSAFSSKGVRPQPQNFMPWITHRNADQELSNRILNSFKAFGAKKNAKPTDS